MAKFGNPFGEGNEVFITQTLHGTSNTAIDCYGAKYKANLPVYAIADGKILGRSSGSGSYCYQSVDGTDIKIWYVHTYNWLATGTTVKKGQKICEIAPNSVNGGYPEHLHLGLTPKGKYYIMNYFDRSIPFRTAYSDIFASWFAKSGDIDWRHFQDLSYNGSTMSFKKGDKIIFAGVQNIRKGSGTSYAVTGSSKVGQVTSIEDGPREADNYTWYDIVGGDWVADVGKFEIYTAPPEPPVEPDCSEYKERIQLLEKENETLRLAVKSLQKQIEGLQAELSISNEEIEQLRKDIQIWEDKYTTLRIEKNRIENEKNDAVKELNECKNKQGIIKEFIEWIGKVFGKNND